MTSTAGAVPVGADPSTARSGRGAGRRGLLVAALLAAVGGGTAALSGTQRWAGGTVRSVLNAVPVAVDGGSAAPLGTAGGLLGLAGVGALLATRTTGRLLVGLLLVAAGVGTAVSGVGFLRDPGAARYTTAGADGVGVGVVSPGSPGEVHVSAWPWLSCAAALLLLVAGGSATVRGRRWPALGRRYESPVDGGVVAAGRTGRAGPTVIWDDLDAGRDPSVDVRPVYDHDRDPGPGTRSTER